MKTKKRIVIFSFIAVAILVLGCNSNNINNKSCVIISSFEICSESISSNQEIKKKELIEGIEQSIQVDNLLFTFQESYYSDNLYENDITIIHPINKEQIQNFKENGIPYIETERKDTVDLDYFRVYNVFFETINGLDFKVLKPRTPFSAPIYYYCSKIPGTKKDRIGYESLTIKIEGARNSNDLSLITNIISSIKLVSE